MKKRRERILKGNIEKTLIVLSIPLVLNQLVQVVYNLIDTFWLGRLGKAAVASPAIVWPIVFTLTMFAMGMSTAGFALISQYIGSGKKKKAEKVSGNLLVYMLILGLLFGAFSYVFSSQMLFLLRSPPDVFPLANRYLKILSLFFPFVFLSIAFSTLMRAIGDPFTAVKINVASLLLNLVLDPFLIFGLAGLPRLGISGAALATGISSLFSFVISAWIIFSGSYEIHLNIKSIKPDVQTIKKITKIGTPAALGNSLNGLAFSAIISLVSSFGSTALAAYGIVMRIINIISSVSFGISRASAIMIGQNIGAELYKRAGKILKTTIKFNLFLMVFIAIFVIFLREPIIKVFISNSSVVSTGKQIIFYLGLGIPFFGIFFPVMQALRAAGKTKISALLAFVRLWVLRVGLAFLFSHLLGETGIWIGIALSNFLGGLISLYFVFKREWMKKII